MTEEEKILGVVHVRVFIDPSVWDGVERLVKEMNAGKLALRKAREEAKVKP